MLIIGGNLQSRFTKFYTNFHSQKANELTGEFSTIMLATINFDKTVSDNWLPSYFEDFRRRIIKLLAKSFAHFSTGLALSLLDNKAVTLKTEELSQQLLDVYFLPHDIQRLEAYTRNQVEYRLILDLTSDLGQMLYQSRLSDVPLDSLQKAILLGVGLQNKSMDALAEEFNMPFNQVLARFYDGIKKITRKCLSIMERTVESRMVSTVDMNTGEQMQPTLQTFADELDEAAKELAQKQKHELKRLKRENLSSFAIKGTEEEWGKVLAKGKSSIVSVKR